MLADELAHRHQANNGAFPNARCYHGLALQAEHFAAEYSSEIRALLLIGTAARAVFYARNEALGFGIEPAEIARSLVSGRGFTMSGVPTAHAAPLFPFIMAGFLKLFGDGPPNFMTSRIFID
jgi:hypothetical protein